ncbi:hypothetical protein CC78DRAFT_580689 [Lojkania enalia]|uniref:DUF8035 domain-containing protein n=1 Tax=Lojkania enalia TaxID=147567 RepID=A0A9P4KAN8_9PLEO|nr:hypothetical protein CC78DRAFT_580689 [Didymosphaeria enalia]
MAESLSPSKSGAAGGILTAAAVSGLLKQQGVCNGELRVGGGCVVLGISGARAREPYPAASRISNISGATGAGAGLAARKAAAADLAPVPHVKSGRQVARWATCASHTYARNTRTPHSPLYSSSLVPSSRFPRRDTDPHSSRLLRQADRCHGWPADLLPRGTLSYTAVSMYVQLKHSSSPDLVAESISVLLPAKTPSLRRYSYTCNQPPPLPPRRNSLALPPLQLASAMQSGGMDSRYYRPASPRRFGNPGRSSTGTFTDPYSDSYYSRGGTSPRASGERISGTYHPTYSYASNASGSRAGGVKYDSYTGRPRRNTLNESDDRLVRPNLKPPPQVTSIPIRTSGLHASHHERPSSPLARSWNNQGDTYIHHAPRRDHKRVYSIDDNNQTKLVAEKDVMEPHRRESQERGYGVTSGGRNYHQNKSGPHRYTDVGDEGYSYTDPASMYRDTEPVWRRPRSGSMERSSRPTSLIMEKAPRSSTRELGPPPSTRGFGKINNGAPRNGSLRDPARSSSIDVSRDVSKYESYPDPGPHRSSSTRHRAPAIHQEQREHRRDTYDEYDRRDRDLENRRQTTADRFEDRNVASRGFGIAPGNPHLAHEHHVLDRQPIWSPEETGRSRAEDYSPSSYYPADRAEARMPEPMIPRERDIPPIYDERSRERDRDHRDQDVDDRGHMSSTVPAAASVATAAAVSYGAGEVLKARERERTRDRESDRDSDRERERERERRKEWDERDRRDRGPEQRRERALEDRLPPAAAAYVSTQDSSRSVKDRRYEPDDRDRRPRHGHSSDESSEERPRHYVDRDAARGSERRKDSSKDAALDPDEEYRRRIRQEAERSGRLPLDREMSESDRERERRRRKEERDRSRGPPSNVAEPAHSRYDDRSGNLTDSNIVQEPDSIDDKAPPRTVQIVAPPKDPEPKPKGILRKPTEKFPEHPESIREGVAPHKDAIKGKDIPPNARWTKIDRKLVNPEALEEAKERYEERMDCVIVLRVLSKSEIQKLADRTREIREAREEEYEHERRDRERRHRSHRDDEDRRRDYEYNDDDESDDDVGRRDREWKRGGERPRMIEAGR